MNHKVRNCFQHKAILGRFVSTWPSHIKTGQLNLVLSYLTRFKCMKKISVQLMHQGSKRSFSWSNHHPRSDKYSCFFMWKVLTVSFLKSYSSSMGKFSAFGKHRCFTFSTWTWWIKVLNTSLHNWSYQSFCLKRHNTWEGSISKECVSLSSVAAASSIPSNKSCPLAISPAVLLTANEDAPRQSWRDI